MTKTDDPKNKRPALNLPRPSPTPVRGSMTAPVIHVTKAEGGQSYSDQNSDVIITDWLRDKGLLEPGESVTLAETRIETTVAYKQPEDDFITEQEPIELFELSEAEFNEAVFLAAGQVPPPSADVESKFNDILKQKLTRVYQKRPAPAAIPLKEPLNPAIVEGLVDIVAADKDTFKTEESRQVIQALEKNNLPDFVPPSTGIEALLAKAPVPVTQTFNYNTEAVAGLIQQAYGKNQDAPVEPTPVSNNEEAMSGKVHHIPGQKNPRNQGGTQIIAGGPADRALKSHLRVVNNTTAKKEESIAPKEDTTLLVPNDNRRGKRLAVGLLTLMAAMVLMVGFFLIFSGSNEEKLNFNQPKKSEPSTIASSSPASSPVSTPTSANIKVAVAKTQPASLTNEAATQPKPVVLAQNNVGTTDVVIPTKISQSAHNGNNTTVTDTKNNSQLQGPQDNTTDEQPTKQPKPRQHKKKVVNTPNNLLASNISTNTNIVPDVATNPEPTSAPVFETTEDMSHLGQAMAASCIARDLVAQYQQFELTGDNTILDSNPVRLGGEMAGGLHMIAAYQGLPGNLN